MISIAICDDQKVYLRWLHDEVVLCLDELSVKDAGIIDFSDSHLFLDFLRNSGGVDVVILDILMPGISGTDIARAIKARKWNTSLIFISSSRDYALEAFALGAVHYITKPVDHSSLSEALCRALIPFGDNSSRKLHLHLEHGAVRNVSIDSITFIESVGYRRVVHTDEAEYQETRLSLADIQSELDKLAPEQFFRSHRWCLINLDAVRSVAVDRITFRDGSSIPVRNGTFRMIRERFLSWSFNG